VDVGEVDDIGGVKYAWFSDLTATCRDCSDGRLATKASAASMRWNWIIVGASPAGCVLAAILSERADSSVILLEAGPDYLSESALPPDIRSGLGPAFSHDWDYGSEHPRTRNKTTSHLRVHSSCFCLLRGSNS
jgi:hypothetical protein